MVKTVDRSAKCLKNCLCQLLLNWGKLLWQFKFMQVVHPLQVIVMLSFWVPCSIQSDKRLGYSTWGELITIRKVLHDIYVLNVHTCTSVPKVMYSTVTIYLLNSSKGLASWCYRHPQINTAFHLILAWLNQCWICPSKHAQVENGKQAIKSEWP